MYEPEKTAYPDILRAKSQVGMWVFTATVSQVGKRLNRNTSSEVFDFFTRSIIK